MDKAELWQTTENPCEHKRHGYVLNRGRDVAAELKAAGVDKVSVSLNAGDKETYMEICKPTFADAYEAVIDFIEKPGLCWKLRLLRCGCQK